MGIAQQVELLTASYELLNERVTRIEENVAWLKTLTTGIFLMVLTAVVKLWFMS